MELGWYSPGENPSPHLKIKMAIAYLR